MDSILTFANLSPTQTKIQLRHVRTIRVNNNPTAILFSDTDGKIVTIDHSKNNVYSLFLTPMQIRYDVKHTHNPINNAGQTNFFKKPKSFHAHVNHTAMRHKYDNWRQPRG